MVERTLFAPGGATELKQDDIIAGLIDVLVELQDKLEPGQEVALTAATIAALETIDAVVTGTVALDAPTLAALESITTTVANWPNDFPDAAVLLELQTVSALLGGTLDVSLPAGQIATLTPQTDGLTDAELRAAQVNVADSGEREYDHVVDTVTVAGNTTVHTPAAGKAIRLHWAYAINNPTSATAPLIRISLGATEIYRVWALSKRQVVTGAIDAPLVVNLSIPAEVAVTFLLEEI